MAPGEGDRKASSSRKPPFKAGGKAGPDPKLSIRQTQAAVSRRSLPDRKQDGEQPISEPATPAYPKVPKLQLHRLPLAGSAETPVPLPAVVPKLALESLATTPLDSLPPKTPLPGLHSAAASARGHRPARGSLSARVFPLTARAHQLGVQPLRSARLRQDASPRFDVGSIGGQAVPLRRADVAPHSPRSSANGQPAQSQPKRTAAKVLTTTAAPQANKAQKSTDRSTPSAQLHAEPAEGRAAVALPNQAARPDHSTAAERQRPVGQRPAVTTWDELAARFEGRYGQPATGAAHQSGCPAPMDGEQKLQPATSAVSQADAEQACQAVKDATQPGRDAQQKVPPEAPEADMEAGAQEVEGDAEPLEQAAQQPSKPNEAAGTQLATAAGTGADSNDDSSEIVDASAAAGTPEQVDQAAACESLLSSSTSADGSHQAHTLTKFPALQLQQALHIQTAFELTRNAMGCGGDFCITCMRHKLQIRHMQAKDFRVRNDQERPRMLTNPLAESPPPFAAASSASPAASGLSEGLLVGNRVASPTLLLPPKQPGDGASAEDLHDTMGPSQPPRWVWWSKNTQDVTHGHPDVAASPLRYRMQGLDSPGVAFQDLDSPKLESIDAMLAFPAPSCVDAPPLKGISSSGGISQEGSPLDMLDVLAADTPGSALSEELATPEVEKWVKEWLQTASPLDRQQALRETSRLSNLNTPGARRLLAELLPTIQSPSTADVASTPFVSSLERTTAELSPESATKDSMLQLSPELAAKDTVDQLSPEPATKDSMLQLMLEPVAKETVDQLGSEPAAKDTVDQLNSEPVAKDSVDQLNSEPPAKDSVDQLNSEPATKDSMDHLSPKPAAKGSLEQLSPEAAVKETAEQLTPAVTAQIPANQPAQETPLKVQNTVDAATPEAWSEVWDSSPDSGKGSPPTVAPKVQPKTHGRSRAGQKSRFFRESSVLPTPHAVSRPDAGKAAQPTVLPVAAAAAFAARPSIGASASKPPAAASRPAQLPLKSASRAATPVAGLAGPSSGTWSGCSGASRSSQSTPSVDFGTQLALAEPSVTPQFGLQGHNPQQGGTSSEAHGQPPQSAPDTSAAASLADAQPTVFQQMMAHLRRGSYDSPDPQQESTGGAGRETTASPAWQTQFCTPMLGRSGSVDSEPLSAQTARETPAFSAGAETPQESSGSNHSSPVAVQRAQANPTSSELQPCGSSAWDSILFNSDSDDEVSGSDVEGPALDDSDSSCHFTPTDSSASSKEKGSTLTARGTTPSEVSGITIGTPAASTARAPALGEDSGTQDTASVCGSSVKAAEELAAIAAAESTQRTEGAAAGDLEAADWLSRPVEGSEVDSPATSSIKRFWRTAAQAAEVQQPEGGGGSDGSLQTMPGDAPAHLQQFEATMESGAALEAENEALQWQLAELRAEEAALRHSDCEATAKAGGGAPEVAFAQCLIELSDHANLVLAAYEADKASLDAELAAAEERCTSAEAGQRTGATSDGEQQDLHQQLLDARRAFEDAQKACEAAEEACQAARAEASRLKEELVQAQAQLQSPADAGAEPARQQGPRVKRMIAQLEDASAMLHRPTLMTVPDTPPDDTCREPQALEVARLSHQICERHNTSLQEELQETQSRLQALRVASAKKAERLGMSPGLQSPALQPQVLAAELQAAPGTPGGPACNSPLPGTPQGKGLAPGSPAPATPVSVPQTSTAGSSLGKPPRPSGGNLRFFGHQRIFLAARDSPLPAKSPQLPRALPAVAASQRLQSPGAGSPQHLLSAAAHAVTPGARLSTPLRSPSAGQRSPSVFATPLAAAYMPSPSRSGSQYYTPLSTGGSQASLPASPVWVSPVPLERWNLITERLKVLRLELKEAQNKLKAACSEPTDSPKGLQLLLPPKAAPEEAADSQPSAADAPEAAASGTAGQALSADKEEVENEEAAESQITQPVEVTVLANAEAAAEAWSSEIRVTAFETVEAELFQQQPASEETATAGHLDRAPGTGTSEQQQPSEETASAGPLVDPELFQQKLTSDKTADAGPLDGAPGPGDSEQQGAAAASPGGGSGCNQAPDTAAFLSPAPSSAAPVSTDIVAADMLVSTGPEGPAISKSAAKDEPLLTAAPPPSAVTATELSSATLSDSPTQTGLVKRSGGSIPQPEVKAAAEEGLTAAQEEPGFARPTVSSMLRQRSPAGPAKSRLSTDMVNAEAGTPASSQARAGSSPSASSMPNSPATDSPPHSQARLSALESAVAADSKSASPVPLLSMRTFNRSANASLNSSSPGGTPVRQRLTPLPLSVAIEQENYPIQVDSAPPAKSPGAQLGREGSVEDENSPPVRYPGSAHAALRLWAPPQARKPQSGRKHSAGQEAEFLRKAAALGIRVSPYYRRPAGQ